MKLDNSEDDPSSDGRLQDDSYETDPTEFESEVDSDIDNVEAALVLGSNAHPPEYYINRLKNFDISKFT
jgi:hypothetical protein